ncbi:DUF2971 domain-containing protein [Colwellia demingiae]|uniref:DUF2971 domain-containing protein n=2 Tax=Colwellia demingiae TaxID=89401 RepID=A0A5C6QSL4_9GAMM|nr:DUF2971 domain-containing protein [Colwellia demingiae]
MLNIPKDKYLCKFATLNKNIINSIYENNLWHARVDTLNDPFEFYFNFIKELPNSTDDLCKLMNDSNYWVKPHLIVQEREAAIQLLALSKENELRSGIINKLIEHEKLLKRQMQTLCVCSLSEAYDEPLMWSHYSDGMRGVCLMFDKDELKRSSLEFEKVEYGNTPPKIDFFDRYIKHKNNEEMELGKFLLTKHTGWTYEKEFRSVSFKVNDNIDQLGFLKKLKKNSLKAIIMGSKISQVDKTLLITLSEKFGFELYIAKANTEDYSVDIKEFK